ncbi:hypothetical protein [Nocardia alni]|uniref:hypothetical protein n=1 Tax=Nocardia alni TaxID=2815723 RepID=UPI001C210204|nr:hypothetical protein [Nocardia alni]
MSFTAPALLAAAAGVGFGHAVLPDHWVPLSVIARAQRYPLRRVLRLSSLAGLAHVAFSLILGAIVILVGLRFRTDVERNENLVVGGLLILTGAVFAVLELIGRGHTHDQNGGHSHGHSHDHGRPHRHADDHGHPHGHQHSTIPATTSAPDQHEHTDREGHVHEHTHELSHAHTSGHPHAHDRGHAHENDHARGHAHEHSHADTHGHSQLATTTNPAASSTSPHKPNRGRVAKLLAFAVPFGAAASPDLTILPVFLAASALGMAAAVGTLIVFSLVTVISIVGLTMLGAFAGYQLRGAWVDKSANLITAAVLLIIGALVATNLI